MFFVEKDAELQLISKKTFGRDEQPSDAAYEWAVQYGHDSIVGVIYEELRKTSSL